MTVEELEGNELIALFMGGELHNNLPFSFYKVGWLKTPANDNNHVAQTHQFKYHNSWEWTMPVAEKINSFGKAFSLAIFKNYISLTVEKGGKFYKDFHFSHAEYITSEQTAKQAMFKILVKFIKWYNEQAVVLICNNCKDYHMAPKTKCECGSTTLTETDKSNIAFVKQK